MVGIDKHKNIFYFYRGPTSKQEGNDDAITRQLENNITKALVNVLDPENLEENFHDKSDDVLAKKFFIDILKTKKDELGNLKRVELQKYCSAPEAQNRIPDAVFTFERKIIGIESKYKAPIISEQLKGQWEHLQSFDDNPILIVLAPASKIKEAKELFDTHKTTLYPFSWEQVHDFFEREGLQSSKDKNNLLNKQFTEYLRLMHMTERFTKYDFSEVADLELEKGTPEKELTDKFDNFIDRFVKEITKDPTIKYLKSSKKSNKNLWITINKESKNTFDEFHITSHLASNGIDLMFTTEERKMPKKLAMLLGAKDANFWKKEPALKFWNKIERITLPIKGSNQKCEFKIIFQGVRKYRQGDGNEEPICTFEFELNDKKDDKEYLKKHQDTIDARKEYLGSILSTLYNIDLKQQNRYYRFRISCLVKRKGIEDEKTIDDQITYFVEQTEPIIDIYKFFQELLNGENQK
ncbi:hypothetical protein HZC31_06010 [Candidatus Woesearchaeota archaeon]|nr:hypothetical protein [Candidatus Woesearchaeota archaeon]